MGTGRGAYGTKNSMCPGQSLLEFMGTEWTEIPTPWMALEGAHTELKTVCAPDRARWNLWERSGQKFQHCRWALEGAHTELKTVCAPDRARWNLWERSGQKFQHRGWRWKGRIRNLK